MRAIANDHLEVALALLKAGAGVNSPDKVCYVPVRGPLPFYTNPCLHYLRGRCCGGVLTVQRSHLRGRGQPALCQMLCCRVQSSVECPAASIMIVRPSACRRHDRQVRPL